MKRRVSFWYCAVAFCFGVAYIWISLYPPYFVQTDPEFPLMLYLSLWAGAVAVASCWVFAPMFQKDIGMAVVGGFLASMAGSGVFWFGCTVTDHGAPGVFDALWGAFFGPLLIWLVPSHYVFAPLLGLALHRLSREPKAAEKLDS